MKTLLVVYHSATGGTRQMAEAAARAASDPEVTVRLLRAPDATADDVLAADGYIFATPENLAALAGVMKDFFDRVYYARAGAPQRPAVRDVDLRRQRRRKRGAANRANCDRLAAEGDRAAVDRVHARADTGSNPGAENHRPGDLHRCEEMGATMAAGLAAGIF